MLTLPWPFPLTVFLPIQATDQHLTPDALAELRPLAVRSIVYIAFSIVLYILVWLDLQSDVVRLA